MKLLDDVKKAKRVYICGNGGSAANAIHMANDLILCGIKAHALVADVSTLTAIANDFGYEHVFSRQLRVYGEPGDLLIAMSGSGNSPNILEALKVAKEIGVKSWALIGMTGGKARELADEVMYYAENMQAAEERQLLVAHGLMKDLSGR
jgi:D-sedoheptulose 7-phosphate isomerase